MSDQNNGEVTREAVTETFASKPAWQAPRLSSVKLSETANTGTPNQSDGPNCS